MLHSIRTRLFMAFIGLLAVYLIIMQIIFAFLMDDIQVFQNQISMEKLYSEMSSEADTGSEAAELLSERQYRSGFFISVVTPAGELIENNAVPPQAPDPQPKDRHRQRPFLEPVNQLLDTPDDKTRFGIFGTDKADFRTVVFAGRLKDGNILVIERPLGSIKETSRNTSRFMMISGGVILLVGSVFIYGLAGRVTAPLRSLDSTARRIASLDFSERVTVNSKDEIGMLAVSIQTVSDNLQEALQDLTEANSKLLDDIERERQLDAQRRRFISSVSHELRTPLSMIQGYADGLRHGIVQDPEDVKQYCEVIVDETRKMGQLIKDMLNLSAYDNGAFPVVMQSFDPDALLQRVCGQWEPKAAERQIQWGCDADIGKPVHGDPLRIEQAVNNLLSNALRHTPPNGQIALKASEEGGKVRVTVFNSGSAMDEEALQNCWEPFFKGSVSELTREGYGLGLAIVRAIINAHQGTARAENADGGVRFSLEWPVERLEDNPV